MRSEHTAYTTSPSIDTHTHPSLLQRICLKQYSDDHPTTIKTSHTTFEHRRVLPRCFTMKFFIKKREDGNNLYNNLDSVWGITLYYCGRPIRGLPTIKLYRLHFFQFIIPSFIQKSQHHCAAVQRHISILTKDKEVKSPPSSAGNTAIYLYQSLLLTIFPSSICIARSFSGGYASIKRVTPLPFHFLKANNKCALFKKLSESLF